MRILLLGSCVTRDAFEFLAADSPVVLVEYFARSALASAMATQPFNDVALERIDSAFQRRVVSWDLSGTFRRALEEADYDLLVLDMIDERFHLVVDTQGSRATWSSEFSKTGYDTAAATIVRAGSREGLALWSEAWAELIALLDARGRRRDLRINRAWWATEVRDGGTFPPVFSSVNIEAGNAHLAAMYERASKDLEPHQFYDYDSDELVAAREHKWGVSPFHYTERYYTRLVAHMMSDAKKLEGERAARG